MNSEPAEGRKLVSRPLVSALFLLILLASWLGPLSRLPAQTWTNTSLSVYLRANALVSALTLSEKIALVQGSGGPYVGNIATNSRLAIPALGLEDGPAGIGDGATNVTALPAPIALAASWDVALARQYGQVLGAEARGKGVGVLLGPMMNMARAYEGGRSFEGSGEEPQLTASIAAAEIQGIQSQGVIATAKHFVCNDQETDRTRESSDVNERTRQEIYYVPFRASANAGVGAFMASYNRINTRYACEQEALNATVKKLWGFDGFIMSDWGANFTTVAGADNGLDSEMPSNSRFGTPLQNAVQSSQVPSAELDGMARRILTSMFQFGIFDNPPSGNLGSNVASFAHGQFARSAASQGIVLLKNAANLLPLRLASIRTIAVLGSVASTAPISTGCGSAGVNLPYNVTPLAGITSRAGAGVTVSYNQGDGGYIAQATQLASNCDIAIVCVGQQTCEGSDRANLSLPNDQDALVSAVAAANPRTVVVLYASSSTLMPWADQVAAALVAWYPGQENGNALASVLFGDVNPAGKLPVTIPSRPGDVPTGAPAQFPGIGGHVAYSEGLLIGYRWYDANNATPLFPFGHGLSFTTFGYSNLTVGAANPAGRVQIGFDLTNTGTRQGAEATQLYLGFPAAAGEPPKLLKGFQKISLAAGQTSHVTFNLGWEDLAYWDASARGFRVMPGTYQVMIGASSRDLRLTGSFTIASPIPASDLANAALHRSVTVSSALPGYPGSTAVDGDTQSAWASQTTDPQWLTVDLSVTKDLSRVRLQWNTNYARGYTLQLSPDGTNFSTIFSTNAGSGGLEEIVVSGRGRYLRVYCTQPATPAAGYSLLELAVYAQPQQPFGGVVHALPGRVQAEDYDLGGQGVAYSAASTTNQGGGYRTDDVGIQPTSDLGGGYNVGWIAAGDWLEYTASLPDPSAIYNISARIASTASSQMRVRLDGTVLGTFQIPNTGGWQNWQTVTLSNVVMAGGIGSKALRVEMLTAGFNLNWVQFDRVQICGTNNIALNQPAACSSVENATYGAANAFDGDLRTRWSSQFSDPQWVSVDLGTTQDLARVRLNFETAYSLAYQIQLSGDGVNWVNSYSTTNGPGGLNDLGVLGGARYVRLYATQRGTQWGDSLWEFEIYPAQLPALSLAESGGNAILSWPATVANWTLESTPTLVPAAQWSAVTNLPVWVNSVNFVTDSIAAQPRFYRLRQGP